MNAHTPGPWHAEKVVGLSAAQSVDVSIYAETVTHHNPMWLARVYGQGVLSRDVAMRDANVRLIAAAPELLEALRATANVMVNILTDSQLDTRTECGLTIRAWIARVEAAIAKAEGRDA